MARELAAVYSHVYGLAVDLSVLSFCDPQSLDVSNVTQLAGVCQMLHDRLLGALEFQNFKVSSSALTLELAHLISNMAAFSKRLLQCLVRHRRPDREGYYHLLHKDLCTDSCTRRVIKMLSFYGGATIEVSLQLINDIELILKKLNSVFYCLSAEVACCFLAEVSEFLRTLRGVSPIPSPDSYIIKTSCVQCYFEHLLLPNQGESLDFLLSNNACDHLCTSIESEPIQGLFENELRHIGIVCDRGASGEADSSAAGDELQGVSDTLRVLDDHNIFQPESKRISDLSTLLYWNSGIKGTLGNEVDTDSKLGGLMGYENEMLSLRATLQKHAHKHMFDVTSPSGVEKLFCGSIFANSSDIIDCLKKDCASTFFKRSKFQQLYKKQNELYVRLNDLLIGKGDAPETGAEWNVPEGVIEESGRPDRVLADASSRRQMYYKKITQDGLQKLKSCLESHEHSITKLLTLRVWGSLTYELLSVSLNHFMDRRKFIELPWLDMTYPSDQNFENSKFIRNSLLKQKLSNEHIDSLILVFYNLITGPLTNNDNFFPLPRNVVLSCCLDSAGALPHQKLKITEMIWPSIGAKDWVDPNFNQFYKIMGRDLNHVQREAWFYIRELVLSVALYNVSWERKAEIRTARLSQIDCLKSYPDGIYLTYETAAPLVLIVQGRGWKFKDIYALLYMHLQEAHGKNK